MSERTNISKSTDDKGNKELSFSKSWEENGISFRKEVRKLEGGYIVSESKYGRPKDEGENGEYIDERKEYITTTNPFEKKEDKTNEEKMFSFIDKPTFEE